MIKGSQCENLPATTTTRATTTTTTTTTTTRPFSALLIPDSPICTPGICQNDGQCYVINGHLGMCFCKPGFNGPNCQYRQTSSLAISTSAPPARITQRPSPTKKTLSIACPSHLASICMNGSTCLYTLNPNVLRCICTKSYTGSFCNIPASG